MEFEDSGIDSDPKATNEFDGASNPKKDAEEPIISFSPDRCRFTNSLTNSHCAILKTESLVHSEGNSIGRGDPSGPSSSKSELHKRLEKRIAQASAVAASNSSGVPKSKKQNQNSSKNPPQPSISTVSGIEIEMKKSGNLIPPQRLAIPTKNSSNGGSKLSNGESKPLVEWDSDESEEELSFFPAPKQKAVITDNLSIESMSGEDDDLHLAPPRAVVPRCPCDPRYLFDTSTGHSSNGSASASSRKTCLIV